MSDCRNNHWLILAALLWATCYGLPPAYSQDQTADKVIVRREQSRREMTYSGRVLDYTNGILRFRLETSGGVRQFKTPEIVSIQTPQTEQHQNGLKLLEARKYQESVVALEAAERAEPRDWVRRDILALLARVHLRQGNRLAAADAFVRLTDSDPRTHHIGAIPLWWSDQPTSPAAQRKARVWLTSPNLAARLIAASILFGSEENRQEAMQTFERLATNGRAQVTDLARVQQWRGRLATGRRLGDAELYAWRSRIKSMNPTERAGPQFLLGKAYSKRYENDRAALSYLWVPLVYPDDEWLAAEANLEAARALEKAGRLVEAESLYRETVERFSRTPFAARADVRLKPREEPAPGNQKP